mmetsp:Transcript_38803/g.122295  ORF Transcript_38803/g.122295 Transcript_38803/m.122295 type:complete len:95 (-) Transcript_38803:135-419(-)
MLDKKVLCYEVPGGSHTVPQVIETARGQALADEFGIKFFETSAKNNINVEKAFTEIARDVMVRLREQEAKDGGKKGGDTLDLASGGKQGKKGCC